MVSEEKIKEIFNNFEGTEKKTFAEVLYAVFKDKYIEMYLGDTYETLSTEQIESDYPSVFCGKVVAAYGSCIVLSAVCVVNNALKGGNLVLIQDIAIKSVKEITGEGIMEDMFFRSKESLFVPSIFEAEKATKKSIKSQEERMVTQTSPLSKMLAERLKNKEEKITKSDNSDSDNKAKK